MTIGLLQCDRVRDALQARHGDYPQLYAALLGPGFTWRTFRVMEGDVPEDPALCDGWLVSGSRESAYGGLGWIAPLEDLIRAIHGTRPLVGICFGHQVIAQALGGRVEPSGGGWAVGRRTYDWAGDEIALNAWHQDQVVVPPPGAEVVASNPFTAHAALRIGAMTLTLQPHPEFSPAFVGEMIDAVGRSALPVAVVDAASRCLHEPVGNADMGAVLARFLRGAHRSGDGGSLRI